MSKELEAFMDILEILSSVTGCDVDTDSEHIKIVKQALLELEYIKKAKPSEVLKCLDKLAKQIELDEDTDYWEIRNAHITVEQALLNAEKEHRYLEILKKNRVDIESFYTTFIDNAYNYKFYEISYGTYGKYKLTEEEFNLLKEVLE